MTYSPYPTYSPLQVGIDLEWAALCLEQGLLVGIPTETVYGLAGNAYNMAAVLSIFAAKRRPYNDPLIVHTDRLERVLTFAREMPPAAHALAAAFWPGPLTLLLPRTYLIPDLITAGLDTVAVRIPNHPLTLQLLARLNFPVAAPSANPFGYISPTTPAHVLAQLKQSVSYVLDGGPCAVGIESTIIGFDGQSPIIHRLGGLSIEQIVAVVGRVTMAHAPTEQIFAPGTLSSHYAPTTPLVLGPPQPAAIEEQYRVGVLSLQTVYPGIPAQNQKLLSPAGNLWEAAHNLYAALREMDGWGLQVIYAELMPQNGIGAAINDRLSRAAAPH